MRKSPGDNTKHDIINTSLQRNQTGNVYCDFETRFNIIIYNKPQNQYSTYTGYQYRCTSIRL